MRKKTRWAVAGAALLGVLFTGTRPAQTGAAAPAGGTRDFQLVYHSDTRGYYRPCG
jgi:hypothetical protein